jgi:Sel1 repeat
MRLSLAPLFFVVCLALAAAAGWYLPHRVPRSQRRPVAPPAKTVNPPAAPGVAESPSAVTRSEYAKLCTGDDVTGCERACDAGDAASCRSLGWHYDHATGRLPRDDAKAAHYFGRACDGGDVQGCANLGVMYADGRGVPRDEGRAASLYERACNAGNAQACTNLGVAYDYGRGVPQDQARAAALYRTGCDGGHAVGCANLGAMFESGDGGLSKNVARAATLYEKACTLGYTDMCAKARR